METYGIIWALIFGIMFLGIGIFIFIISHSFAQDYQHQKEKQEQYEKWKTRRNIGLIIIVIGIAVGAIMIASSGVFDGTSSSDESARCEVCNTRYSDRENVRSINRTNMCSRCYKNYKYASDMLN